MMLTMDFKTEGEYNMPPKNMPLGHLNYFELKVIKKQQTQTNLWLFPIYLKSRIYISPLNLFLLSSSTSEEQPLSLETEIWHQDGLAQAKLTEITLISC